MRQCNKSSACLSILYPSSAQGLVNSAAAPARAASRYDILHQATPVQVYRLASCSDSWEALTRHRIQRDLTPAGGVLSIQSDQRAPRVVRRAFREPKKPKGAFAMCPSGHPSAHSFHLSPTRAAHLPERTNWHAVRANMVAVISRFRCEVTVGMKRKSGCGVVPQKTLRGEAKENQPGRHCLAPANPQDRDSARDGDSSPERPLQEVAKHLNPVHPEIPQGTGI